jgi:5-methylthioadenosine/S-adenosylhomocysteine deaminase
MNRCSSGEPTYRVRPVYRTTVRTETPARRTHGLVPRDLKTDEDAHTVARLGASLAHCSVSNLANVAPILKCLELGVNVGTGFGSADMWEVMRVAYYLHKGRTPGLDAETVFRMATVGAQRHTIWRIGKIAEGYAEDVVFVDESYAGLLPTVELDGFSTHLHNPLIECRPHMLRDVMIEGKWEVTDGRITTIDE